MAELQGLQQSIDGFRQHEAQVVAISVDSVEQNAQTVEMLDLEYPVLSDPEMTAVEAYDLKHVDAGPEGTIARSATFVIDEDGVVRWRSLTESVRLRPRAEEVVAEVAKLG